MKAGSNCAMLGSPPHMRGKELLIARHFDDARITPACAGKRRTPKQCVFNSRDHPRVCGEKLLPLVWKVAVPGSPPHVRGKVLAAGLHDLVNRITPAYAGKRPAQPSTSYGRQDHPRVCGEKIGLPVSLPVRMGSPPRMRGKGVQRFCPPCSVGITPACAGKRPRRGYTLHQFWDHPRMCGEKLSISSAHISQTGSPPHVRGKAMISRSNTA